MFWCVVCVKLCALANLYQFVLIVGAVCVGLGRVLRLTTLRRYTWLILFLPFRCL